MAWLHRNWHATPAVAPRLRSRRARACGAHCGDQQIEFSAPASGIYYVVVDPGPGATEGIDYTLTLSGDATPTPTPLPSTPTQTPAKGLGDVNNDASVNSIDAALVLQYIAGLLGSLANPSSADVDASGAIDSIDAALILQYSAGIIGTF